MLLFLSGALRSLGVRFLVPGGRSLVFGCLLLLVRGELIGRLLLLVRLPFGGRLLRFVGASVVVRSFVLVVRLFVLVMCRLGVSALVSLSVLGGVRSVRLLLLRFPFIGRLLRA